MDIDLICHNESLGLARRSPKYWLMLANFYIEGKRTPEAARVFQSAYFFCRHIDDVLDGDRQISSDPRAYVEEILASIENDSSGPEIMQLYRFSIGRIEAMARPGDNPKACFISVIKDAMLFDYDRSKERRVLTRAQLESYYEPTVAPGLNLSLIMTGSSLRSQDLPEMVSPEAHIYSIRDLKTDLERGIINIPQEELASSGLSADTLSYESVRNNPHLSSWMAEDLEQSINSLRLMKPRLSDPGSRKICLPLITGMELYCTLYRLSHR